MNLNDYFDPVDLVKPDEFLVNNDSLFSKNIRVNTPSTPIDEISDYQIALVGVPEDRNSNNRGSSLAPDRIRGKLYQLFKVNDKTKIIDLGNLKQGNSYSDTYVGLQDVLNELINNHLTIIILGGTQDLTSACFKTYEKIKNSINVVSVDYTIDNNDSPSGSDNYLSYILASNKVFKFSNIGHQQYRTDPQRIEWLEDNLYESVRLGSLKNKIYLVEPIFRDCDLVSFDIGALRQSDAPGRINPSPNGLFADEACQIARYSGMSDRTTCFGIFEINPKLDLNDMTSHTAAQMIWYFIEGFSIRKSEHPSSENPDFKFFIISHDNMEHDITFIKSHRTDRWWMEVPIIKTGKKIMVACSFEDYQQACNHDIPDIWWKSFRKIN